jgi:hypothetical protein
LGGPRYPSAGSTDGLALSPRGGEASGGDGHPIFADVVRRASVRSFDPQSGGGENDGGVLRLSAGDLIYLERLSDVGGGTAGVVYGDANLGACGVEAAKNAWRFTECVFRVVSKLDYRAREEHRRQVVKRDAKHSAPERLLSPPDSKDAGALLGGVPLASQAKSTSPSDLELAKERSDMEARQNAAALERMARGEGNGVR